MARRAKTGQLNFGCPPEEKAAFEAEARRVGLSLSAWLRQAARAAAGMPSWSAPEVKLSAPPSPADLAGLAPALEAAAEEALDKWQGALATGAERLSPGGARPGRARSRY